MGCEVWGVKCDLVHHNMRGKRTRILRRPGHYFRGSDYRFWDLKYNVLNWYKTEEPSSPSISREGRGAELLPLPYASVRNVVGHM